MYGRDVRMAYMDVPPPGPSNGRTVVLLHGMNFGGFYFGGPIEALRKEGFRVIVPDQIGFGRSSKPIVPYNFHDMAANTRRLLEACGVTSAAIVGHSMGGMLAALRGIVPRRDGARGALQSHRAHGYALGPSLAHSRRCLQSYDGTASWFCCPTSAMSRTSKRRSCSIGSC